MEMPKFVVPVYKTEQFAIKVDNNAEDINASITGASKDGWLVQSITPSGKDIIILYHRISQPDAKEINDY